MTTPSVVYVAVERRAFMQPFNVALRFGDLQVEREAKDLQLTRQACASSISLPYVAARLKQLGAEEG